MSIERDTAIIVGLGALVAVGLLVVLYHRRDDESLDPRDTPGADEEFDEGGSEDPWAPLVDEDGLMHLQVPLVAPLVPLSLHESQGGGITPVAFFPGSYNRGKAKGPEHWHRAVDIRIRRRTPVLVPVGRAEVIIGAEGGQWSERGGHNIRLLDLDTLVEHYIAHLDEPPLFAPGTIVTAGLMIGSAGNSGNATRTKCHIHYQLKLHKPRKGYSRYPNPYNVLRHWWPKNTWKHAPGKCIKTPDGCSQCLPRLEGIS